jgi:hypothetical protein
VLAVCVAGIGSSDASSGFPAPSAAPCPQSPTPQKGAVDKRTDATAVCYFLPEVYFTPSSGTVAVNQSFTFTLEVRYAEYGCSKTGAWSGSIATNSSGQYGPQLVTVGPFGSPGTYTYGVSCGGLGGTNPGNTTVTVTAPGSEQLRLGAEVPLEAGGKSRRDRASVRAKSRRIEGHDRLVRQ